MVSKRKQMARVFVRVCFFLCRGALSHCTTKSTSDIHTYVLFVSHKPSPLRCSLTPVSVQGRWVGMWERTIDRRPLSAPNSFLISWHNRLAAPPPERTRSVCFLLSKFFFFVCARIILQSFLIALLIYCLISVNPVAQLE